MSQYLLALVMDDVTRDVQGGIFIGACSLRMMWFLWMGV
jgi:hypothetical protein